TLGRMRDFGARTAIFRRGTRPRKARRKGICRGQTGQWVTPFRVLRSPFTLMEFRAFSFPVAEVILSDMASLSSDLSDKKQRTLEPNSVLSHRAQKTPFWPHGKNLGRIAPSNSAEFSPPAPTRVLGNSLETVNSIVHIIRKSNAQRTTL
ncbi:MAG TPA: hypothetical protein H9715_05455, partial [Candidatus Merdibacter merdigallinarum]|nr:hypothetical protein [Candidatus Merdibacter merdigallinarum]